MCRLHGDCPLAVDCVEAAVVSTGDCVKSMGILNVHTPNATTTPGKNAVSRDYGVHRTVPSTEILNSQGGL